jgi:hypothetical protein
VTEYEQRNDGFTAIEDQYACYTVYDPDRSKIGKVDDVFLDETDQPEYIGVKMGFLGTSSTLIPMDIVTVDQTQSTMTVSPSPRAPSRTGRPSTTGRSPPSTSARCAPSTACPPRTVKAPHTATTTLTAARRPRGRPPRAPWDRV